MKPVFTLIIILISGFLKAQMTFSGQVLSTKNEVLAGVNIFLEGSYTGTTSDKEGRFVLENLPKTGVVVFSMIGFDSRKIDLRSINTEQSNQIELKEAFNKLKAVTVSAGNIEVSDEQQAVVLKPLDIVTTSGALGDIIGALNTLPGTASNANDGRLFVRGGSANETALFIDGLRLGNAFGSTLNGIPTRGRFSPQLFKGSFFSTGAYSAEFGQALSSVLSLNSLDFPIRNQTDFSLMTVGGALSHTQVWERQSLTANLSYTDLAAYMLLVPQNIEFKNAPQGISTELLFRQKVGKRGMLKTFYAFQQNGLEVLRPQIDEQAMQQTELNNRFHHFNLNYRQDFSKKHLLDGGLSYSYNTDELQIDSNSIELLSALSHAKLRYQYFANSRLNLKAGTELFGRFYQESFNVASRNHQSNLAALFAEATYYVNSDLVLQLGLRQGFTENSSYLMPRTSIAYKLNEKSQLALAYGDYFQDQSPDILIQKENLRSSNAQHWVLNYQYSDQSRTLRLEAYHKNYQQLLRSQPEWNTNGEGYARGFDLFYRDRGGINNLDYWISYSFIDSRRHWAHFQGQVQPSFAPQHNASFVSKYWINALKSQLGTSFNINDGFSYENPNLAGEMESKTKAFHSFNLSWSYLPRQNLIFHFEVTNVLGRDNVFGYEYSRQANADGNFRSVPIAQAAKRFIFFGIFYTLSTDKNANQLNNL